MTKKKLLIVGLSVAMGTMLALGISACGIKKNGGTSDADTAKEAIKQVTLLHNQNVQTETPSSYMVDGETRVSDKKGGFTAVTVTWTVSSLYADYTQYVSVGTMTANKQVPINITQHEDDAIAYTLTASVTVGKEKQSANFNHSIPASGKLYKPSEVLALGATLEHAEGSHETYYAVEGETDENGVTPINVKGYVVGFKDDAKAGWNESYKNLNMVYIGDTAETSIEDALYVYRIAADDVYLTGPDSVEVGDLVTLNGALEKFYETVELTYKGKLSVTVIALQKAEKDDASVLASVKENFVLNKTQYLEVGDYDLPVPTREGASVVWSMTGDANVKVEDGKLKVTALPNTATDYTLKATLSYGTATPVTKEFPIKVLKIDAVTRDSEANPLTPSEAIAIAKTLENTQYYTGTSGAVKIFNVKGKIVDPGTWTGTKDGREYNNYDKVYIIDEDLYTANATKDTAGAILIYRIKSNSALVEGTLRKGGTLTISCGIQSYNGTPELGSVSGSSDTTNSAVYVAYQQIQLSDQEKADEIKTGLTISKTTFTAVEDVTLTTTNALYTDATIAWTVATNDYVEIANGNTLHVKQIPETGSQTVTVTATVTVGTEGRATKDFTVTVKAPGSEPVEGETATIDFTDDANRDSITSDQEVWSQNGITITHGKGTGNAIDTSKNYFNPIRIYKNHTFKIEYSSSIAQVVFHSDKNYPASGDYSASPYRTNLADSLKAAFSTATVTEDESTNDVTLVLATPSTTVEFTCTVGQARLFSLDVSTKAGTVTPGPGPDEPEVPTGTFTPITTPAEGTDYYLGMDVKGTYRYLTGNMSGFYFETTTDVSEAAKVALEKSGNGWVLKVNSQFIEIEYALGTDKKYHTNVKFNATQTSNLVWEWNETHKVFTMKANDTDYYLGSYTNSNGKTFETMSASELTHITNATSYPAHLGTFVEGSEPAPEKTADEKVTEVKNALTVNFTNFKAVNAEIDLDEVVAATKASEYGVSVAWEITEPATGADVWVKVEGNKLKLVSLPDASKNFTLTARLTLTGATDATKEFNFTLQPEGQDEPEAGSAEKPFTPSEAVTYGKANLTTNGATTQQEVYATGYVIDAGSWKGTYWQYVYIADDASYTTATKYADSVIEVFKLYPDNTYLKLSGDLIKGMQITVHGHLKNYTTTGNSPKTTYEFDDYKVDEDTVHPVVSATTVTREQRVEAAKALVGNLANDDVIASFDLPDTAISGISYEWSVTPTTYAQVVTEQGKSKVKITRPAYGTNNQKATLSLKITCDGTEEQTPLTWELTIKQKPSTTEESELYILPSAHQNSGSSNSYTGNCDVTYNGVTWNVEGNSQIQPWRFGGKAASKEETATFSRKLTSKTAIQGKVSKIVLTLTDGGNITVNSVTLKVYDGDPTSDSAQEVASKDLGTYTKDQEVTINADEGGWTNCYYVIIFNVSITGTSNRWVGISSLEFRGTAVEE